MNSLCISLKPLYNLEFVLKQFCENVSAFALIWWFYAHDAVNVYVYKWKMFDFFKMSTEKKNICYLLESRSWSYWFILRKKLKSVRSGTHFNLLKLEYWKIFTNYFDVWFQASCGMAQTLLRRPWRKYLFTSSFFSWTLLWQN